MFIMSYNDSTSARNTSKTTARFPFKRNRLRCMRCVNENRKKRKRLVGKQSVMVATASTEHSYWLALAFVA